MLNLGCGKGRYKELFPDSIGFDIQKRKEVDVVGDAHALPFDDDSFDTIICMEVLEHLHTPHQAIAEMQRVLKQGGMLILSTRFIFPLHDTPHDYFRYTKYGLRYLFRDWEIVEMLEENHSLATIATLLFTYAGQADFKGGKFTKALVLFTARIIKIMPPIAHTEYSTRRVNNTIREESVMTSGYYLACRNKK